MFLLSGVHAGLIFLNMVATSGVCYNIRCVPIFSKSMMMFGSLDFLLRADYRSKWQEPKNVFLWMLKFSTSEIEAVKAAASELEDFDEDEEEEDEEDEEMRRRRRRRCFVEV